MNVKWIILPVLIPLLAGIGIALLPFRSERVRERFTGCSVLLTSLVIFALLQVRPSGTLTLLTLAEDLPLALKLDGLGIGRCCRGAGTCVMGCPPTAEAIAKQLEALG